MGNYLLEVRDLQVGFKIGSQKLVAVNDVSFHLERGRTLGIVGESGCGKSVTANAIMRLLPKQTSYIAKGEISLDGTDLLKLSEVEMCEIRGNRISMIFQDPMTALNPVYTIGTQLMEVISAHQTLPKKQAYQQCVQMLEKVGIPAPERRMKAYPHELSGGMRQRVMIAMGLLSHPELLIADEPTTALDVTIQAQILELMAQLKTEFQTSVILITHDMGVIAENADDVMVMYAGEVVEKDCVKNLFQHPMHPYTLALLRSIPRVDQDTEELYTIEGMVPSLADMPAGCHFSNRCSHCKAICREQHPPQVEMGSKTVQCWLYAQGGGD